MSNKKEIIELRRNGATYQEIADKYSISRQRVHQIITGYKSPATLEKLIQSRIREERAMQKINQLLREKINLNIKYPNNKNITHLTGMESGSRDRNRELVRIRDKYTCQICGKVWQKGKRRFDVHHLDEDKNKTRQIDNLLEESKNMITLCHSCHLNLPGHKLSMKKAKNKSYE
ncbi:helix-turn-helix domain-containing protein [Candidatus Dojkabacteria bacterium]|jgi:5-methylcytosine-specific restriction endonuclease McrA|nr:helix-turn-helix domain-containing protein [Candidatus Dojkabacteria bacterium]